MESNQVDEVSKNILGLLTDFSNEINIMAGFNNQLLQDKTFYANQDFMTYIYYFDIGRYYHFRCMGYMECLVMTKCYYVESLCCWKNQLVMPAYNNITVALKFLDKLTIDPAATSNRHFKMLINKTEKLKQTAMKIMDDIKLYNLSC